MARTVRSYRAERERRARRNARIAGLLGFLAAAVTPVILWHDAIALLASDFHVNARDLITGWLGYGLMAVGLLCLIPVLLSIGRKPESRFYPHYRNAWAAWGVSCYLLGIVLAVQDAAIANGYSGH
jgi:hypothetical protein